MLKTAQWSYKEESQPSGEEVIHEGSVVYIHIARPDRGSFIPANVIQLLLQHRIDRWGEEDRISKRKRKMGLFMLV